MNRLMQMLDGNGNPVGLVASDYIDARVLAATTAEAHTVPTGAKSVRLTGTGAFYVDFEAAAAIPAADITDGSSPILIPADCGRLFSIPAACTAIGLIAAANCVVTMEFYS